MPGITIGINVPVYPQLVLVPGYPVYYDPRAETNYFFYDGLYWVFQGDNWYVSSWYNGPWQLVAPVEVPLFVLRIPVRYYRHPPAYFRGWHADAAETTGPAAPAPAAPAPRHFPAASATTRTSPAALLFVTLRWIRMSVGVTAAW